MTPPAALCEALESGRITDQQLRELISFQAAQIGLTLNDALRLAADDELPTGPIGTEIELLIGLLAA